ncbi:DUF2269 family protein [Thalassobacillus pellis]|uniref:DUF2269 family protein n=1 Tax=Thalassobacillus pellis TaxID=748008 RepID=UPI0019615316|nr:DUF2269 family protein [Thalassobacillus pellis]MBM7554587.1 putative membrane protein [Thalassobacillus pellis]
MLYLILKYIHILAAILMIGMSLANGVGKVFADRTGNVHRMAAISALTVYVNKRIVLPSLVVLAFSGIGLGLSLHVSFREGWIFQAMVLLVILVVGYFVGNHYETRLHHLASDAEKHNQSKVSPLYWQVSNVYYLTGAPVLVAMVLSLYLMVFQRSLF